MIRVLFITHTGRIGGAEGNLLNLLRFAECGGFMPAALLLPEDGPLAGQARQLGVPVGFVRYHAFRWRNPIRHLQTLSALHQWVRRTQADVIHLNHQWLIEFAVKAGHLTCRPVVCHIRNLLGEDELAQYQGWLEKVDAIAGVSRAVLEPLLQAGLPPRKTRLVYNGIDFQRLQNTSGDSVLHRELDLPPSVRIVGVLGRVVAEKGIEEFLEAAALIAKKIPQTHFVIVGEDSEDGAYISSLREEARRLEIDSCTAFTGFRDDIAEVLHDLDLLVLPSRSSMPEGLPNSVLEALAVGRLVVATRNSGVPEVVSDGINGFLVDCDDVEALAVGMARALALPATRRDEMEAEAIRSVQDRTMDNQATQLVELYHSLLTGSS